MSFEIQFLGAAGTVTGSKYLLTWKGKRILVDCGLFQCIKSLRLKNWNGFPVDAADVDAIILTHGHIDHSGYIPRLIKKGFRGPVFCTPETLEVCRILLPDSGYLMEEEAAYLNKAKLSRHHPALPLFTAEEAEKSLKRFTPVPFGEKSMIGGIGFEFFYAGHILGAASVVLEVGGRRIAFTGDVGRMNDRIFHPPAVLPAVDYLVTESTYGNKLHEESDPLDTLERIVNDTWKRRGVILIPAFAVGRAQAVIHYLAELKRQGRIPSMPMYLNSPMASDFGEVFLLHREQHRLTAAECDAMKKAVAIVRTVEESKALNERSGPMLIISASGMLSGGRVLHHLKAFVGSEKNTILLTGFQSAGTRGEALQRGVPEIKIHGQYWPVRAKVEVMENMSAHADYREMLGWFGKSPMKPRKVFVTHGEVSSADEFRRRLAETFGWNCVVPIQDEKVKLE